MKPIQLTCILRVSKSQMMENGFKDSIIDSLYGLLLEYLSDQSNSISFPDTTLLCVTQMKQFLKKCSVANYNKKMRQILEKIEQNNQFIENERKKTTFSIKDLKQIEAWETNMKVKGTPISTFYGNWKKVHTAKKLKEITENDKLGDFNLPILRKGQKPPRESAKPKEGPVELFPSDSESEEEKAQEIPEKKKRGKRGSKKRKAVDVGDSIDDDKTGDIVQDTKASDW